MSKPSPLGIKRIAALGTYVHDLERARRFYVEALDFAEIGASNEELERRSGRRGVALRAGGCTVLLFAPAAGGREVRRFLRRHPEGVGTIVFEVEDAARAFALLEERGGTPIEAPARQDVPGGALTGFTLATPLGDTTFELFQREGAADLLPGLVPHAAPAGGTNQHGFTGLDHVTVNLGTKAPALLWLERVVGLSPSWEVALHTGDEAHGSGLRSTVMADAEAGVRIACNEPWRPRFHASQVHQFLEAHGGDGVQHAALGTEDIRAAVRGLRARGVAFRAAPRGGSGGRAPPLAGAPEELRELGILADASAEGRYLLQIFMEDAATQHGDPTAGPFFFELIQRAGEEGFGEGNFRALFESVEEGGGPTRGP